MSSTYTDRVCIRVCLCVGVCPFFAYDFQIFMRSASVDSLVIKRRLVLSFTPKTNEKLVSPSPHAPS